MTKDQLTKTEKALLNIIQQDFPITSKPFKKLSAKIGLSESEILSIVKDLKDKGVIRRIGAIFDYKQLGYVGTLVACKVAPEELEQVAQKVNQFKNVTHNYARSDAYNLWFTLIAESDEKIAELIGVIGSLEGVEDIKNLPAIRLFKINVSFDFYNQASKSKIKESLNEKVEFSPKEKQLITILQQDLPLVDEPFNGIASRSSFSEQEVMEKIKNWLDYGVIRRFGTAISHQKAGIFANGMIVWRVDDKDVEMKGNCLAAYPQVTHCYQRLSFEGWPYNLYSMVHGPDKGYVLEMAEKMAQECKIKQYKVLFSTREFKKSSFKFFNE